MLLTLIPNLGLECADFICVQIHLMTMYNYGNSYSGGYNKNNYSGYQDSGFYGGAPTRGGGDWGRKSRQMQQDQAKHDKAFREAEFFW